MVLVKKHGSLFFYAFPQEVVNQIAERTGGRPVAVRIPDLSNGEVEIDQDGRIYLVKRYDMGNGEIVESLVFQARGRCPTVSHYGVVEFSEAFLGCHVVIL